MADRDGDRISRLTFCGVVIDDKFALEEEGTEAADMLVPLLLFLNGLCVGLWPAVADGIRASEGTLAGAVRAITASATTALALAEASTEVMKEEEEEEEEEEEGEGFFPAGAAVERMETLPVVDDVDVVTVAL